jgi:putative ABC transport system permease protein
MRWIPDRYQGLRSLLRPDRVADEVDEELLAHVEMRVADLIASGMSEPDAREEALRRFGDVNEWRTMTCEIDESILREQRRMEVFDSIRRETRHAVRSLVRAPLFTGVAVLTLALGIGATTAIFTLLDSIVLRPLSYPHSERLVQVSSAVPKMGEGQEWGNSVGGYFNYVDANRSFDEIGGFSRETFNLSGDGGAERVDGANVTASLLRVLGARTVHGHLFTDAEDSPGAGAFAILGYDLWRTRFNADPAIIGKTVRASSVDFTVVGVLEPGFTLPDHDTKMWIPAQLDRSARVQNYHWLQVYGRLKEGVTPAAAQADLQRIADRWPETLPTAYSTKFYDETGFHPSVETIRSKLLGGIERVLWMLLGAVGLVLMIACANVANLMLVRSESRRRELTVRSALGAERAHLLVHYLSESVLLAVISAALGVLLAFLGVRVLIAMSPDSLPRVRDVAVGARSLGFASLAALLTALVFGVVPALRSRVNFGELRESGRGTTASKHRQLVRSALVIGQVGMALVLLAAGALMLQSFVNLRSSETGLEPDGVLTFQALAPYNSYSTQDDMLRFHRALVDGIEALPGVESMSATTRLPFSGEGGCAHTVAEGRVAPDGESSCTPVVHILPDYFSIMGMPIISGRAFDWRDVENSTGAVVVSRALAKRLWGDEDPLGRRIGSYGNLPEYTVVGVVDDNRGDGVDKPPVEAAYYATRSLPHHRNGVGPWGDITFVVKTSLGDPASLQPQIRELIRTLDPEVPLASVATMDDVISSSDQFARTSFTMLLLGVAAAMALFLSAVGLYGVIAYLVGRRRAEIGVRMALGARISQVAALVMMQSLKLALAGVAIGLIVALFTTRLLESLLFEIEPSDPVTLTGVSGILLLIAVLASLLPARRAARTDPSEALRAD